MTADRLPRRAEEWIKSFVRFHERLPYFLDSMEQQEDNEPPAEWITQLCAPTFDEVVAVLEDASSVYTSASFIQLLYRDSTYQDIRDRHIRLIDALEPQSPRLVLEELFKHLAKFTAEDRARSFLLLASEVPSTEAAEGEDNERIEWLDRIAESFEVSPRALRAQLLLAASIVGHEPMVTLLLRDIAGDDELAPNIDAVEAECLIEAAINQHFSIVKELLVGGRFSNGNETCWDAIVQALEVSCTNGAADITDILLPHYLSYCSVISSCGAHHPRLLRLALSNWHFEIVELLLECDPRGTLCNMMELIDTLREEVAQATQNPTVAEAPSGLLVIVVGEDNDDMGDLVMWDAAALARGVSLGNPALVRFLVNHVDFCLEALTAAKEAAQDNGNQDVIEIIADKLQRMTEPYEEVELGDEADGDEADEMAALLSPLSWVYSAEKSAQVQIVSDSQFQLGVVDEYKADKAYSDPTSAVASVIVHEEAPVLTHPRSADSSEALRTASFGVVEHVISTARQSVALKRMEVAADELTHVSAEEKADKNIETEEASESLTVLEQHSDTNSVVTLALLRQFSSKTADQIRCVDTLPVALQKMEESAESENAQTISPAMEHSQEPSNIESEPPTAGVDIAIDELALAEEETNQVVLGQTEDSGETVDTRLTSTNDGATAAHSKVSQASDFDAATEIAVDDEGCGNPAVSDDRKEADQENSLQNVEATTASEILLRSEDQLDHTGNYEEDDASRVERMSMVFGSSIVAEPEKPIVTLKVSCSTEAQSTQPQGSPSSSPTRLTIVCPVKWVEHAVDTPETPDHATDTWGPLREGDHVEVHYKGRPILFPGVIVFCHANDAYDVVYEDGEEESCIPRDLIQLVDPAQSASLPTSQSGVDENLELQAFDEAKSADECHLSFENCSRTSGYSLMDAIPAREDEHCDNSATTASCGSMNGLADDASKEANPIEIVDARKHLPDALSDAAAGSCSRLELWGEGGSDQDQATRLRHPHTCDGDKACGEPYQMTAVFADDTRLVLDVVSQQLHVDNVVSIEHLPEIPSIVVPSTTLKRSAGSRKELDDEVRLATGASQRRLRGRGVSVTSQRSRCRTADNVSSEEIAEWKNVDLLLNRKRRLFQSQAGNVESVKVPWGEEFATIQSLKRFAAQHPDVLRAHIESQLRELDVPLSSPGKPRSPKTRNVSAHSGAGQARGSLLLMKDLAFLLQLRLAPFFDSIVPVVMPMIFSAEKRFLCETAVEAMEAVILHCSGRNLVLLFLQLGQMYSKYEDSRLYNLTSVYIEKSVRNWRKTEFASLQASPSSKLLLTLLAKTLSSKSAPVRISAQKSFKHLRDELGPQAFETMLRAHVASDLEALVLKECGARSLASVKPVSCKSPARSQQRGAETTTVCPRIAQSGPSILQRMLLRRQNRVLPTQT